MDQNECLNNVPCDAFMLAFFSAIHESDEYIKDCYDDLVNKLLVRLDCQYSPEFIQLYIKYIFNFIVDNSDRLNVPDICCYKFVGDTEEIGEFLLCVYECIVEYLNYSDSIQYL